MISIRAEWGYLENEIPHIRQYPWQQIQYTGSNWAQGYAASSDNKTCVVLDTHLNEDLIFEGLAREFVRKVQSLRKDADFVITDHIKVYYNGTDKVERMLKDYRDYVMGEVLGDELIKDISLKDKYDLNDEEAYIKVERV